MLGWSVGGRPAARELPKGLAFTGVALDEEGRHIAISASSGLHIGTQRDEVWLVRVADGVELFRRYGPKYSRSTVALPAGRYLALDEILGVRPTIRVYSIPDP